MQGYTLLTGVYIIFFLFCYKNILDPGYCLEPYGQGGFNDTHNLCFEQEYEKNQTFFLKIFLFFFFFFFLLVVKFSIHVNRRVFVKKRANTMLNDIVAIEETCMSFIVDAVGVPAAHNVETTSTQR